MEKKVDKNNSLDKALKILDLFIEHTRLSMTEISKLTGYSTSATGRMLVSLADNHYLYREGDGLYRLSYKIVLLNNNVELNRQLSSAAQPVIDRLSEKLGFVVSFSMLEHDGTIVPIARSDIKQVRYLIPSVGTPGNPENSASGKVMLAVHPERDRIISSLAFNPLTPHSLTSKEALYSEFDEILRTGFGYDREELVEGLYCVAKRVPLPQDIVMCALSVSGYKLSMLEQIDLVRATLSEATLEISQRLHETYL